MNPTPSMLREQAAVTPNAITALELRVRALELEVAAMNDVHEAAQTLRAHQSALREPDAAPAVDPEPIEPTPPPPMKSKLKKAKGRARKSG